MLPNAMLMDHSCHNNATEVLDTAGVLPLMELRCSELVEDPPETSLTAWLFQNASRPHMLPAQVEWLEHLFLNAMKKDYFFPNSATRAVAIAGAATPTGLKLPAPEHELPIHPPIAQQSRNVCWQLTVPLIPDESEHSFPNVVNKASLKVDNATEALATAGVSHPMERRFSELGLDQVNRKSLVMPLLLVSWLHTLPDQLIFSVHLSLNAMNKENTQLFNVMEALVIVGVWILLDKKLPTLDEQLLRPAQNAPLPSTPSAKSVPNALLFRV